MRKMSVGVKWRKTKQTMSSDNQRAESSSQKKMIPRREQSAAWNTDPRVSRALPSGSPKASILAGLHGAKGQGYYLLLKTDAVFRNS